MKHIAKERIGLFNQVFLIENNWRNILYLHTPFCLRKCNYCIYGSRVPSSQEEIKSFFNDHLPRQMEQYQPVLENIAFDEVYFGGGTPSITDAETLEKTYNRIPHFKDIPLKATEISPYTVTDEHIELFRRYRFGYVSMGVQTLDNRVLEKENRLVVNPEKINYLCRRLDEANIISNVDLIFCLDSGGHRDLEITGNDLETMMSTIRPVSMTLYYNYRAPKSIEGRKGAMQLVKEMLGKYPEYKCVNSMLEDDQVEYDMINSVEYRLMRNRLDFNFYMLQKVPQSYPYGHNMLAVGEYGEIQPRYNYYYIYDFMEKYMWKDCYNRAKKLGLEFEETREELGLPYYNFIQYDSFFVDETGKERFKEILKQTGNPYYEL